MNRIVILCLLAVAFALAWQFASLRVAMADVPKGDSRFELADRGRGRGRDRGRDECTIYHFDGRTYVYCPGGRFDDDRYDRRHRNDRYYRDQDRYGRSYDRWQLEREQRYRYEREMRRRRW